MVWSAASVAQARRFISELNCGFGRLFERDLLAAFGRYMGFGHQHVNGRDHKQRENRTDDHAANQHIADPNPPSSPCPRAKTRRKWPQTVAAVVIRMGRSRVLAAPIIACSLLRPVSCR